MRKFYILLLCALSFNLVAQVSFTDDFESYTADQYVGPQSDKWTTWGLKDGTAEDALVKTDKAASGTKSIYFESSNATGGPQDVVVPFGQLFTEGVFNLGMKFFIPAGKTAYFNLQGDVTIGKTWSINVHFDADGKLRITNSGSEQIAGGNYDQDTWIDFVVSGNLSANLWSATVDGNSVGTFKLTANKVASIDIYPTDANAQFWMDDFFYNQDAFVPKPYDAAISGIGIAPKELVGIKTPITVDIVNLGANDLVNPEFEFTYNANTIKGTASGLTINSLKSASVSLPEDLIYVPGTNDISVSIKIPESQGIVDSDPSNNSSSISVTGVVPAQDRIVVVEEATGTWCRWCPRGAVALDRMSKKYPDHFIGIAVHNADPMVVTEYDAGIRSLSGFTGFPQVSMNRINIIDPSESYNDFFNKIDDATRVIVKAGAFYDANSRKLLLATKLKFKANVNGQFKVAVVLTEDGVTGTDAKYAQANAYAGGGSGPMGGFELLPDPVPANKMVYDHVARAIVGGFRGQNLPKTAYKIDDELIVNMEVDVPTNVNIEKMHIIPLVFSNINFVENGAKYTLEEAIAEGYIVDNKEIPYVNEVKLYPNPFVYETVIDLNLEKSQPVSVQIFDTTGKLIGEKNYGVLIGENNLTLNGSMLNNGNYIAKIKIGNEVISKNILIQR